MENFQHKIQQYFDGKMTPEESVAFETQIAENQLLAAEFQLEKTARLAIQTAGRKHLAHRLQQIEDDIESPVRKLPNRRNWLLIAASVALLLGATWWIFNFSSSNNSEQIFANYFDPYRSPVQVRGEDDLEKTAWELASEFYQKGNFEKAILEFEKAATQNQQAAYLIHFYQGVALISQKNPNPENAIILLEKVLDTENNFHQQADWYRAMAYLNMNEPEKAKTILENLLQKNDFKKAEIEAILKMME